MMFAEFDATEATSATPFFISPICNNPLASSPFTPRRASAICSARNPRMAPVAAAFHLTMQHNSEQAKYKQESEITPPDRLAGKTPTERPTPVYSKSFVVDPDKIQSDPEENMRGFVKTRGSLIPGEEFVFWWVGNIYDIVEGQNSRHLFAFEGYSIGRMLKIDGGWRILTREVGLYKDKETGEILDEWENPETGAINKCIHVWNDPVNGQFLAERDGRKFNMPTTMQDDAIYWHSDIFLRYKSPLTREEFPKNSQSDTYQATEMFQFFTKREDLASEKDSIDCDISWMRVGQWVPWMEMGDRPGQMVYHCRGRKLRNGFSDLSGNVRNYVHKHHPEYASAPTNYTTPNETSWTYMKKMLAREGPP